MLPQSQSLSRQSTFGALCLLSVAILWNSITATLSLALHDDQYTAHNPHSSYQRGFDFVGVELDPEGFFCEIKIVFIFICGRNSDCRVEQMVVRLAGAMFD